ncbi:DHA2 family efflux MFS transporter permease subunit, partial [Crenobacter luteus]
MTPPLAGAPRAWATAALSLAAFMQVLDSTIATVAIATIAGDLGASASQGTWVITSFAVANAISVPVSGWLARRVGEVRLFLVATLGFVAASWLCGVAPSLEALIACRVLQGALAGPVIPLSQSLLLAAYPDDKKGMALALWSTLVIVAPVCGPVLGGWIADRWHWGWLFFINVPLGLLCSAVAWRLLRGRETPVEAQPVDRVGLVLLVLGVGALQLLLDRGRELDWFESAEIVALAVVAVVALAYLLVWERHEPHPVLALALFRRRNFTVGVVATSVGFLLYLGAEVLIPLLLQTQHGYTAERAGLAVAPVGLLPVLLSPLLGRYVGHVDLRWLVTASFLAFAACFAWRATSFLPGMAFEAVVWPQLALGLAVAGFFMPLTAISFAGLRPEEIAGAAALANFLRTLAGSIGASGVGALWERREALHHARLAELAGRLEPDALHGLAMQDWGAAQADGLLAREIARQAAFIGANEIFWGSALLFLLLIALVWLAR